jgi:hypothetical protein
MVSAVMDGNRQTGSRLIVMGSVGVGHGSLMVESSRLELVWTFLEGFD